MDEIVPSSVEELAEALGDCGSAGRTVELGGNFTKRAMGGEIDPADVTLINEPADSGRRLRAEGPDD